MGGMSSRTECKTLVDRCQLSSEVSTFDSSRKQWRRMADVISGEDLGVWSFTLDRDCLLRQERVNVSVAGHLSKIRGAAAFFGEHVLYFNCTAGCLAGAGCTFGTRSHWHAD